MEAEEMHSKASPQGQYGTYSSFNNMSLKMVNRLLADSPLKSIDRRLDEMFKTELNNLNLVNDQPELEEE